MQSIKRDNLKKPIRYNFTKVWIACKAVDQFKDYIQVYTEKFEHEYVNSLIDYRNTPVRETILKLRLAKLDTPFADVNTKIENKKYAEEVKDAEKDGIFLDPKPNEELNKDIFKPKRGRPVKC